MMLLPEQAFLLFDQIFYLLFSLKSVGLVVYLIQFSPIQSKLT